MDKEREKSRRISLILPLKWPKRPTNVKLFSKLLRSRSDTSVTCTAKPAKRKFCRIVKNAESEGEEFENPHVVRRYTKDFVEKQQTECWEARKYHSLDERPYEITGVDHPILKRQVSLDLEDVHHENTEKHAHFSEHVDVFDTVKKRVQHEPLSDEKCPECGRYVHDDRCSSREGSVDVSPAISECAEDAIEETSKKLMDLEIRKHDLDEGKSMRRRSNTFDLHHLGSLGRIPKLTNIFKSLRSRSETTLLSKCSPGTSPATRRRRFVRVVRDDSYPIEYKNEHVVRKMNEPTWGSTEWVGPLPYTVDADMHTILKKQGSSDCGNHHLKHARFSQSVEIVELSDELGKTIVKDDHMALAD